MEDKVQYVAEAPQVEVPAHWIFNDAAQKAFMARVGKLNLDQSDVLTALGEVEKVSDYDGDLEAALYALTNYATRRDMLTLDGLQPQPAKHHEAQAIAWVTVYTAEGTPINVTARQVASADDVAATVLALVGGLDLLKEVGIVPSKTR